MRFEGNLDLTPLLSQQGDGPLHWMGLRNDRPGEDHALDEPWTEPAVEAAREGKPWSVRSEINNEHRAVGARLSGELAVLRAKGELDAVNASFDLHGTAGQSFGAFAAEGLTLKLTGQANDFVGKGLCGAELELVPVGRAAERSDEHVLLGNVALYGATGGKLFAAGRAGERFAVRNSGATAVVEGVGDHACEYMTGGVVTILGEVGVNFGAGMTGGLAWIRDADGTLVGETRYHDEFLGAQRFADVPEEQGRALRLLLEEHVRRTGSRLGEGLLSDWTAASQQFVLFTPKPQA